jgi:hypothetical protein
MPGNAKATSRRNDAVMAMLLEEITMERGIRWGGSLVAGKAAVSPEAA